jgi:hypothetical protein
MRLMVQEIVRLGPAFAPDEQTAANSSEAGRAAMARTNLSPGATSAGHGRRNPIDVASGNGVHDGIGM